MPLGRPGGVTCRETDMIDLQIKVKVDLGQLRGLVLAIYLLLTL